MALGTAGDVDTADIVTDVSFQVKMKNMNGLHGQSKASSRDMVGQNSHPVPSLKCKAALQ